MRFAEVRQDGRPFPAATDGRSAHPIAASSLPGSRCDPPRSLHPGDLVECEIEGIGALRYEVVGLDGADGAPR